MEISTHRPEIRSILFPSVTVMGIMDTREDASFSCPKCGTTLSPDDESEETYSILDYVIDDDGTPQAIHILCGCGQEIILDLNYCFPSLEDLLGR
jgi:hypothetical protein